jgi:hypothetical protein
MIRLNRTFITARRSLALTVVLGAGLAVANAQQQAAPAISAQPNLNLQAPIDAAAFSSSSSADNNVSGDNDTVASVKNPFDFLTLKNDQPPRRGYNRPRYRGGNTNADGSNKYAFLAGAGFTLPVGNTYHYLTPSWGFQVGGGRNFNKDFGVMLQFDWDNFGFTGRTLAAQSYVYNTVFTGAGISGLDGNSHLWSFTLNPTFNLTGGSGEGIGTYVVAGVGFYHKTANFFVPTAGLCYDVYYGYYTCAANQTIDKYSSNAAGFNGGFGLTYKVSHFSNERLYAEVRYVFVDNQHRAGITSAIAAPTPAQQAATNFFPYNSNRTSYFPVKFGVRF